MNVEALKQAARDLLSSLDGPFEDVIKARDHLIDIAVLFAKEDLKKVEQAQHEYCAYCTKVVRIKVPSERWKRYREEDGCKCPRKGSDIRTGPKTLANGKHWRTKVQE
jgi:hypothetical protein